MESKIVNSKLFDRARTYGIGLLELRWKLMRRLRETKSLKDVDGALNTD